MLPYNWNILQIKKELKKKSKFKPKPIDFGHSQWGYMSAIGSD